MENDTELPALDPRPLILKRMVWDTFPHDFDVVKEVQAKLGLVPDHDEGLDVEHTASDTRVNRVAPMEDTIQTLAGLAAEISAAYLNICVEASSGEEVPGPTADAFSAQNTEIIADGAYAIVSHLMDTGVLVYGPRVRGE